MKNKAVEALKKKAPADFTRFFQNRVKKEREVIGLLERSVPTSGSPVALNEASSMDRLKDVLKRNHPYISNLLLHDKSRFSIDTMIQDLTEALQGDRADEQIMRTLQALMYSGVSLEEYVGYDPKKKSKNGLS